MKLETTSEFDLIGQNITITNSKNNELVGFGGMVVMEKKNMVILDTEKTKSVLTFLEALDDDDDVQHVYANLEINSFAEKNSSK